MWIARRGRETYRAGYNNGSRLRARAARAVSGRAMRATSHGHAQNRAWAAAMSSPQVAGLALGHRAGHYHCGPGKPIKRHSFV
jgi:hypothetical protein